MHASFALELKAALCCVMLVTQWITILTLISELDSTSPLVHALAWHQQHSHTVQLLSPALGLKSSIDQPIC